jgi:type I restriction enzyme R subunit
LLESKTLQQQATNNTKEQFGASPDLLAKLNDAIMDAYDAHTTMSQQALGSKEIQMGLLKILLDYGNLYENLRARAQ